MATNVLRDNQVRIPFLGQRMTFVKGLDPLGLQNAPYRAYSTLMPGLNNVTGRLRFYSFYCWLLDQYSKHWGNTDPKVQHRVVRMAEYLLALISQQAENNIQRIPGSNFAADQLANPTNQGFDLQRGVYHPETGTRGTYWVASFGALGQYYLGALRQLGLVVERSPRVFARTSSRSELEVSGEQLAAAFQENIGPEKAMHFIGLLQKESVDRQELATFLPAFDLSQIPQPSNEHDLLLQLLTGADQPNELREEPETWRQQTLVHLLSFLQEDRITLWDRTFTRYSYDIKGQQLKDECLVGWYYYQFNDYWQVACTAIFNGLMQVLQEEHPAGWMSVDALLGRTAGITKEAFQTLFPFIEFNHSVADVVELASQLPNEWQLYEGLNTPHCGDRIAYGFALIWNLFAENQKQLTFLDDFARRFGWNSQADAVEYFSNFPKLLKQNLHSYIHDFLWKDIIIRHQYVAIRKLGSGIQSTQKFILEEGKIRYLGNFNPGFTGPRIFNLISFLQDLNIINQDKKLSVQGIELIKKFHPNDS